METAMNLYTQTIPNTDFGMARRNIPKGWPIQILWTLERGTAMVSSV